MTIEITKEQFSVFRKKMEGLVYLPTEDWGSLQAKAKLEKLEKGEFFIKQDENTDKIGVVIKGELRVAARKGKKRAILFYSSLGKNSFAGDLNAHIFNEKSKTYIEATEESEVVFFYKKDLEGLIQKSHNVAIMITLLLFRVIERSMRRIRLNRMQSTIEKLSTYFNEISRNHSQIEISDYLNMTPATVGRNIGRIQEQKEYVEPKIPPLDLLRNRGWVKYKRMYKQLDEDGKKELLEMLSEKFSMKLNKIKSIFFNSDIDL